jgi:hypothetical protein
MGSELRKEQGTKPKIEPGTEQGADRNGRVKLRNELDN